MEDLEKKARRIAVATVYSSNDHWMFRCPVCKVKIGYFIGYYTYEEAVERAKNHLLIHLKEGDDEWLTVEK